MGEIVEGHYSGAPGRCNGAWTILIWVRWRWLCPAWRFNQLPTSPTQPQPARTESPLQAHTWLSSRTSPAFCVTIGSVCVTRGAAFTLSSALTCDSTAQKKKSPIFLKKTDGAKR